MNKGKKFKHLSYVQRIQLEGYLKAKISKKDIANLLGCCLATVYNEINRGLYTHTYKTLDYVFEPKFRKVKQYSPNIAQDKYNLNATAKGRPVKLGNDYNFVNYIQDRVVKDKISACAVLGEIKAKNIVFDTSISKTTLYRYIHLGYFDKIRLTTNRQKKYRKQVIKRVPRGISIEKRPEEISSRSTFGHWEMDCVCGSTKSTLLVLSERLTRKELIFKMPNQKSNSVIKCIDSLERKYGSKFKEIFKSITVDNGSEFSNFKGIEKSIYSTKNRTNLFYCHPYSSWERGTNERLNREIRRLIPKSSDLSKYSNRDISNVESWVNNYPRQVLNYSSSSEVFNYYLSQI